MSEEHLYFCSNEPIVAREEIPRGMVLIKVYQGILPPIIDVLMIFIARQSADQQVETRTLRFRKIEMQSFVLIPKTARSKSQGRDYTESGSDKDVKMQSEQK